MVRTVLRHAGALRMDHIMGLFRLWWIPNGMGAGQGAYVRYDHEAMVGVLLLEAYRAGAVIIGEDLGTVEPWARDYLTSRGILLKPEFQFSERFSIASGLRLSFYKDALNANYDYFLWQIKGDINNTNYIKIDNIEQRVYKLGIPLEFRLSPRRRDHFVRQYFLVGALFDFATFTNTKISTYNEFSDRYKDDVKETIPRPNNFSSYYYAGIGLKIGKAGYPSANFEVLFPMISFGEYMISSFSKSSGTGVIGIATSLKIPIAL